MKDTAKMKKELIGELEEARRRIAELEALEGERRRREEELKTSEKIYRDTVENMNDALIIHDFEGRIFDVNNRTCELLGYEKGKIIGEHITKFTGKESMKRSAGHLRQLSQKGSLVFDSEAQRSDGSIVPINISARIIYRECKSFVQSFLRDITELKQAEEALRESEERMHTIVSSAPVVLWSLDKEGIFTLSEGEGLKPLGLMPGEVVGQSVFDVYRDVPQILEDNHRALSGEAFISIVEVGNLVYESHYSPMRDKNGEITGMVGVSTDITERKEAEEREKRMREELYHARRLASIGELAAGVAHEINNPLTGIIGFSQRLLKRITDEETSRVLQRIYGEAQRVSRIVENLLTFARRRGPKKEYVNINEVIQRTLELRAYELRTGNINLEIELASHLPKIMVDFQQIQEVYLNLILNAEQVMSEAREGGTLSIKTERVKGGIRVSFADNGPGIPAENLERLFNPFFTTREGRGGTGLGLSICHGIVTEHGGKIYAKSKPGEGATFFVELPVTAKRDEQEVSQ